MSTTSITVPTQVNGWFLTDDGCFQYCYKHKFDKKGGVFSFLQAVEAGDHYNLVHDFIDIYDFVGVEDELAYEYLIDVLEQYGYGADKIREHEDDKTWSKTLLKSLKEVYGDSWKQILAEMFFEVTALESNTIKTHLKEEEIVSEIVAYVAKFEED